MNHGAGLAGIGTDAVQLASQQSSLARGLSHGYLDEGLCACADSWTRFVDRKFAVLPAAKSSIFLAYFFLRLGRHSVLVVARRDINLGDSHGFLAGFGILRSCSSNDTSRDHIPDPNNRPGPEVSIAGRLCLNGRRHVGIEASATSWQRPVWT
jgi:hypothetical protein